MSEKSHVGMGHSICPVCTKKHDEVVLLDRRLRKTLTSDEMMGFDLCEEHQKLCNDGYVALVGIDENKSTMPYKVESVYRTGAIAHLKIEAFTEIFNAEVPENPFHLSFCDDDVFTDLAKLQQESANEN